MRVSAMQTLGELRPGDKFWHRGKEWIVDMHVSQEDRVDWHFLEEPDGIYADVHFEATMATCIGGSKPILFILPTDLLVSIESPYF